MQTFIFDLCDMLKLTVPVNINFKMYRKPRGWSALYKPKYDDMENLIQHNITISLERDPHRNLESLIAHELIHAWQEENSIADFHGKPFQKMAKRLQKYNRNLTDVYIASLDD
jgi:hypothetical protein